MHCLYTTNITNYHDICVFSMYILLTDYEDVCGMLCLCMIASHSLTDCFPFIHSPHPSSPSPFLFFPFHHPSFSIFPTFHPPPPSPSLTLSPPPPPPPPTQHNLSLRLITCYRTFFMFASSESEADEWVEILNWKLVRE